MAIFTEKAHGAPESEAGLSIIGAGMRVEGDIVAEGVVKIEGTVVGTVRAGRQGLVAKGGEVVGDVITKEVIIGGEVWGIFRAFGWHELRVESVGHLELAVLCLLGLLRAGLYGVGAWGGVDVE